MILRGQIVADCRVTSNGDADQTGYPVASCAPEIAPVPAHDTNIWGNTDVDRFEFGDATGVNDCPTAPDGRRGCATPSSDGYIFLGSKTMVHGSPSAVSPGGDGEDQFIVWYLQSMNVIAAPAGLADGARAPATASRSTARPRPTTTRSTRSAATATARNYVINILDTGALERRRRRGSRSTAGTTTHSGRSTATCRAR